MIESILWIYLGGCIPSAVMAWEDERDGIMSSEDALLSVALWPVLTVVWLVHVWRGGR